MAITGRVAFLAAVSALIVGLVLPSWAGVLAVNFPLLLAILCDLLLAAPVSGLRFTRSGDTVVRFDEDVRLEVTVHNPTTRLLRARVRDAWPPSTLPPDTTATARLNQDGVMSPRHKLAVPPGERRRFTTVLRPSRRGDHHADRISVRSYGPLGLAARQGHHRVPCTVRVLPPFPSRRHLPARLARLRELDGRMSSLTRGQGTEFDSLRTYLPGDDPRSIDWRATARRSDLAIRTWRPERDRRLLVVLDTGRTAAARVGDAPRLDASMDAALLLAALASRAGDRVDLMAYDRRIRTLVQGRNARDILPALVDALSPVDASLVETDAHGLVTTAMRIASSGSLIVLLTTLDAPALEEGLLPVMPLLTRRNRVLVGAVSDPRVDEMAEARGGIAQMYEAAVGLGVQAEREAMRERLRRHGATVVDAPPETFAPALADAYLSLKQTGRL